MIFFLFPKPYYINLKCERKQDVHIVKIENYKDNMTKIYFILREEH